jgi:hypothetical protein
MSGKTEVINNYIFITPEQLKKFFSSNNNPLTFIKINQGNQGNYSIQSTASINFNKNETPKVEANINANKDEKTKTTLNSEEREEKKTSSSLTSENEKLLVEIPDETMLNSEVKKDKFFIQKKHKRGRMQKNSNNKGEHTKYYHDNIFRKIRVKFWKNILKYINNIIESKYKDKIKVLIPLSGKVAQNNTLNFNYNLFNTKLKDIFISNEINGKFIKYDKSYNENVINTIYKENIQELINILEMTFLDVFKVFRDVNEKEKLVGFERYDTIIKELKSKEEDDYIAKLEKSIMDFENFYLKLRAKK